MYVYVVSSLGMLYVDINFQDSCARMVCPKVVRAFMCTVMSAMGCAT